MSDSRKPGRPGHEDYRRAIESMETFVDITVEDLITLAHRAEQIAEKRESESLPVASVMSRSVHTVHPETPLSQAAHLMVVERISGLPVVDGEQQLVGIITEADFLRALGVPAQPPHQSLWQTLETLISHLAHNERPAGADTPTADHMMKRVVTVEPHESIHDVLEKMKRHAVKRIVVCDAQSRVVGMVTRSDLIRVFFDRYTGRSSI